MSNRREFMVQVSLGASALALTATSASAQGAMLSETDPTAVSQAYKADAKKVDKTKFPKFAAGQQCNSCALFQGKATDKAAPCPLFPGKQVAAIGWCNAYTKKG